MMKKCLKCKTFHNKYGTYCSRKCANSRIITKKTKEKISATFQSKHPQQIKIFCVGCEKEKEVLWNKRFNKCCSRLCLKNYKTRILSGRHFLSGKDRKKGSGGYREKGGRQKYLKYESKIAGLLTLNKDEIRVAKILDKLNLSWKRNNIGFKYKTTEEIERKYYPDFYIKDYNYYLEYKGWCTEKMTHKMKEAKNDNDLNLFIIYSEKYKRMGLDINELEKRPELLLEHLGRSVNW